MHALTRALILAVFASLNLHGCSGDDPSFVGPITTPPMLSSDASLAGLSISAGVLSPGFQSATKNYAATVNYLRTDIRLTATKTHANATITTNGVSVISGEASDPIALTEGVNTITVTIMAEDGVTMDSYSVAMTRQSANNFAQQAYIKASNTGAADSFGGGSVSLHENTLAVGSRREDSAGTGINADQSDNSVTDSGAVYVFTRDAAATWSQQAYIKASNTDTGDQFGWSVSLYENTLAVGAGGEDSAGTGVNADQSDNSADGAGAAYVFTRDQAGIWSQQAYIKASNTDSGDEFGRLIALHADTLAVAAKLEDSAGAGVNADQSDNSAGSAGAAYVFTRDQSGTWSQQAYIKASNTDTAEQFGRSIALYENTLAVGAQGEDGAGTGVNADQSDNSAGNAGAAYVFNRDGAGTWSQQAYIKASNTDIGDEFGTSVALYRNTLAVTSRYEDGAGVGINANQSDNSAVTAGAAYVFIRDVAGTWSQQAYIKASNTDAGDEFGMSVALYEDTLAVSAYEERSLTTGINGDQSDNSSPGRVGAVYVFIRDGLGSWSQKLYVKGSNTDSGDVFTWMTIFGDTLAVGANGEDSSSTGVNGVQSDNSSSVSGAVYVFE